MPACCRVVMDCVTRNVRHRWLAALQVIAWVTIVVLLSVSACYGAELLRQWFNNLELTLTDETPVVISYTQAMWWIIFGVVILLGGAGVVNLVYSLLTVHGWVSCRADHAQSGYWVLVIGLLMFIPCLMTVGLWFCFDYRAHINPYTGIQSGCESFLYFSIRKPDRAFFLGGVISVCVTFIASVMVFAFVIQPIIIVYDRCAMEYNISHQQLSLNAIAPAPADRNIPTVVRRLIPVPSSQVQLSANSAGPSLGGLGQKLQ